MNVIPSLAAAARAELGVPATTPRDATLPNVAPGAGAGAGTTQPALQTSLTQRAEDAISRTLRKLGSAARPMSQALADVANGTANVLTATASSAMSGVRASAGAELATLFGDGILAGERSMPRAPRTDGNRVELLVRNEQYVPQLMRDLESAKHSITVNQFNWEPDGSGLQVAHLLERKAREGLDVRVTVDGYGIKERGRGVADALEARLEAAGVRFERTDGFKLGGNGFEHRKLITVDDRVAFTGGLGFGEKYDTWTDVMLRIEGPAAAAASGSALGTHRQLSQVADAALQARAASISTTLRDATSGAQQLREGGALRGGGALADATAAVTLLDNQPGVDLASTEAFLRDAASAKTRLWATSTYLTTDIAKDALIDAAKRGVDVKLLVTSPHAGNDTKQIHIGRTMYPELLDAGVELYEWPGILHAKTWLVDDDVAAVGSMNLSKSSMARAREITARVEDPGFAQRYADFHTQTRAGAHLVQPADVDSLPLKVLGVLTRMGLQF